MDDLPQCPKCDSQHIYKDGLRYLMDRRIVQRFLCRDCSFRFSKQQKSLPDYCRSRHGKYALRGVDPSAEDLPKAVTALTEILSGSLSGQAGATQLLEKDARGKIVEFLWWMQKQGYRQSTILSRGSRLARLVKLKADLSDPESVKEVIASQGNWSEARKEAMVYAYDLFAKWSGVRWTRPIYKAQRKLPFIPLEREIDDLTASCNGIVATFLQLGKETGARAGELYSLQWKDMDLENRTINITAEKGSNPRIFRVSSKLTGMLNGFSKQEPGVFSHYKDLNSLRRCFDRYRKRTAHKLGNPRILQITFHTLRHWKATTEYHRTKDILHVMRLLGHRNIKNTLLYTQLMDCRNDDDFICKVAKAPSEIQELIESGFEYVCSSDNLRFFRKRK